jgi:triosephosphate isomerase (TIM)
MRRKLIAGNWKMNTDFDAAMQLSKSIRESINELNVKSEVLLCPPFTNLIGVAESISGSGIKLGAQNCEHRSSGAFTGEISISMLKSVGCQYVIIGHSERRSYYGETDETVNLKVKSVIEGGLTPVICIGETLDERNSGYTFKILERQINKALTDIDVKIISSLVIAYEPVWAIGTGVSATTQQAGEAHSWIRKYIVSNYGKSAEDIRILYGGSMNEKNSTELLGLADIDGGLIGGASLKADAFLQIIKSSEAVSF